MNDFARYKYAEMSDPLNYLRCCLEKFDNFVKFRLFFEKEVFTEETLNVDLSHIKYEKIDDDVISTLSAFCDIYEVERNLKNVRYLFEKKIIFETDDTIKLKFN